MNKRTATLSQYGISRERRKELYAFCRQYSEWKEKLEVYGMFPSSQKIDGMPFSKTNAVHDITADTAIRRTALEEKIKLIEDTAKEAAPDMWQILIKNMCYGKSFYYLRDVIGAPISQSAFKDRRKYFIILLNERKI